MLKAFLHYSVVENISYFLVLGREVSHALFIYLGLPTKLLFISLLPEIDAIFITVT
jgi:hypothetical protein